MTDADATHRELLEFPADDGVRGRYADLLQEAGEEDRAEFIRVQCQLALGIDSRFSIGCELGANRPNAIVSRGFVSSLTGSWSDVSDVLDKLLWQPPRKCKNCDGTGYHRYPDCYPGTPNYSDTAPCSACRGVGEVGVPFSRAMQPITHVKITSGPSAVWETETWKLLVAERWPGIKFEPPNPIRQREAVEV